MRLLNINDLRLEFFIGNDIPPYAILSHTWGQEEISYAEFCATKDDARAGWRKIVGCCKAAKARGFEYVWIDTCCIDKSSSAELSEAINSMFQWYAAAGVCIALLADIRDGTGPLFHQSRWFTRGWTLQELISPVSVVFYDEFWVEIGSRDTLRAEIEKVTRIPAEFLHDESIDRHSYLHEHLSQFSVAQKMSWAAQRITTRPEDVAYCLLGIFDINMPLLYGEGQKKAFRRLQEEIIKSTDDDSIFAWISETTSGISGLLAGGPEAFGHFDDHMPVLSKYTSGVNRREAILSNRGLHVNFPITNFPGDKSGTIFLALLNFEMKRPRSTTALIPAILLQRAICPVHFGGNNDFEDFVRIRPDYLLQCLMSRVIFPIEIAKLLESTCSSMGFQEGAVLREPQLKQIYVPFSHTTSKLPGGILFSPEPSTGSSAAANVEVLSRSPWWQLFDDIGGKDNYIISFDLTKVPCKEDIIKPHVLGVMELLIHHQNGSKKQHHVAVVVGVKNLPPNPLNAKGLYLVPWATFETVDRVSKGDFSRVQRVADGADDEGQFPGLGAYFTLSSRHSRSIYVLNITSSIR